MDNYHEPPRPQKHPSRRVFSPDEGIMLHPIREYDSVVDSFKDKYSSVSLVPYIITTGIISRSAGDPTLIGYCTENPLEVLGTAFPNFHVVRLDNYEFFGCIDFEQTDPMLGLSIRSVEPLTGIDGRVEQILRSDKAFEAIRDESISVEDIGEIISRLNGKMVGKVDRVHAQMSRSFNQMQDDRLKIVEVLERYAV